MKTIFKWINIIMGCINLIVLLLVLAVAIFIIWSERQPEEEKRYPLSSEAFVDEYHDFDWVGSHDVNYYHIKINDYRDYKYNISIDFGIDSLSCNYLFHKGCDDLRFEEKHKYSSKDTLMMQRLNMSPDEYHKRLIDICYFAIYLNQKYQIVHIQYRNPNKYSDNYVGHIFKRNFNCMMESSYSLAIIKVPYPLADDIKQKYQDKMQKYDIWFYEEQKK